MIAREIAAISPPQNQTYWYLARPVFAGGNGSYDAWDPRQAAPRDAGIDAAPGACP